MKRVSLNEDWSLCQIKGQETAGQVFSVKKLPCQVHDALVQEKVIENPNITGINHNLWVGESDWKYVKRFYLENAEGHWNLIMDGLDTFAQIYINGKLTAENKSAYMPCKVYGIQGLKKGVNEITLIFKAPVEELKKIKLPEEYERFVPDFCKARVFRSGYHSFSGPLPNLIRMGIFGEIWLEQVDENGFQDVSVSVSVNETLDEGSLRFEISYYKEIKKDERLRYILKKSTGEEIEEKIIPANEDVEITVGHPALWWPRSHGRQELYEVEIQLIKEKKILDTNKRYVGFRRIEKKGDFDFYINGRPVKIWGVNLSQTDSMSGCYHREKMEELLFLAELAHCNCIRVWGESELLPDEFYDTCDKKGLLVWQDFYLGYNMYNVEENMMQLYAKEAEWLVKRLRHHPGLLLWCGGNEVLLSRDFQFPDTYCYGEVIFKEIYPEICRRLDGDRYYHINCPSGGKFANDPREGDSHGYTHQWYVPQVRYPVFLSENARFSPPALRSMQRMLTEEELWPKGYNGKVNRNNPLPWPASWEEHSCGEKGQRWGPTEHYYDPESPEELIHNLGAAHSEYIKNEVERMRRGKPDYLPDAPRRTKGHILWKLNNCSNLISYGIVDYFNEPQMAYYALKRAYEPLQVSFSIEDRIGIWMVNDTPVPAQGRVIVTVFNIEENQEVNRKEIKFTVEPDESKLLSFLDDFGQIKKECVLAAQVVNNKGDICTCNFTYLDIERHLNFPEQSGITVSQNRDELVFSTKYFARSIEILGDDEGDTFGWLFEDNYFDLLPGMTKTVKIKGRHKKGKIKVKPYYDVQPLELVLRTWDMEN